MFEFILKNKTLLISVLIVGITMGIIAIILGLTMTISSTMVASFCLCFFAIIFIGFGGYNLMYYPKTSEDLKSPVSSTPPSTEQAEAAAKGGYYFYK